MESRIPRVYRAEAVVLRTRRLGDADRILTLFTPNLGKIDAVAKGVRRQTSRKAGHLEPLTLTSLLLAHGRSLDLVTDTQTIDSFLPLREDLERLARGLYAAELIDRFHEDRTENYPAFRLLVETLGQLANSDALDVAVRRFELQLLAHTGFAPRLDRCVVCSGALTPVTNAFSVGLGGVVCPNCRQNQPALLPLSVNALKVLRFLRGATAAEAIKLRLAPELNAELEALLRSCVRAVLEVAPRAGQFLDAVRREQADSERPRTPTI
jgi:DNA repair protein RecO (recombination protein O)